jgi:glutathione S-transferase
MAQSAPLTLYRFTLSGNAHRVELFLNLLDLDYETVDVDLRGGEQRRPEFLALNPEGRVPVLVDGGTVVTESTAILVYLAEKYDRGTWLPRGPLGRAQVQKWLAVTAHELVLGPSAARLAALFGAPVDIQTAQVEAHALLARLERDLTVRKFLVGDTPTIADVSVYTYVAHAPEGGISLDDYGRVRAWVVRMQSLPGFIGMARAPVEEAA